MRRHSKMLISLAFASLLAAACEKPAPKEMTPEHEQCVAEVDAYAECKLDEASQLGELAGKQIKRSVEANQRLARGSMAKCKETLQKLSDDPCAP